MRRTWLAGIAGAVLVGGLSTGVMLAAADPDANDNGRSAPAGLGNSIGIGENNGRGFGPPPWANSGNGAKGNAAKGSDKGSDKAWKDAWHALTSVERKQTMRDLAKAHEDGMRDFAKCVADARGTEGAEGSGRAAPADCDKPLPPGQAKRNL